MDKSSQRIEEGSAVRNPINSGPHILPKSSIKVEEKINAVATSAAAQGFQSNSSNNGVPFSAAYTSSSLLPLTSPPNITAIHPTPLQQLSAPQPVLTYAQPQPPIYSALNAVPIHVATAGHPDPVPAQNQNSNAANILRPQLNDQNNQNDAKKSTVTANDAAAKVKLATVPTNRLAAKSIVSLNHLLTIGDDTKPLNQRNTITPDTSSGTLNTARNSLPQHLSAATKQLHGWLASSYSSASNATIIAQQMKKSGQNSAVGDSSMSLQTGTNIPISISPPTVPNKTCTSLKRPNPSSGRTSQETHKYIKAVGGKHEVPKSIPNSISPQAHLQNILKERGYSSQNYCALESGYYCKPTAVQKSSYGMKLIQAVRQSDPKLLNRMLSVGLSPNPCNKFGESIVHMVCRRGDYALLKVFLNNGCSVQVSDDFGRTPLHDACWTTKPCFKSVELILGQDLRLLNIVDCRGSTPLSYVKHQNWAEWIEFFERQKELYWKKRDIEVDGEEGPPILTLSQPHSKPINDPEKKLPPEIIQKVANGEIEPEEACELQEKEVSNGLKEDVGVPAQIVV